jgi:YidC/Oxa1 family membrane protein insertase
MQRLQQLQPEIKRLQERYKDDRQRMNQEIMGFYQREKVNPLGSCLPLILQIPFFISLFYLLRDDKFQADIEGNEGFLFIPDLADKVTGEPVVLVTLILLYIVTQLGASAVTAISADPMQRRIMFALPFLFVVFIINFEAGLIVYWITTNVWTVGQQLLVRKLYPKPEPIGPRDEEAERKPARGKPVEEDGKPEPEKAGRKAQRAAKAEKAGKAGATGKADKEAGKPKAAVGGGNGRSGAKPPPSPRKKKKRSGRRR